MRLKLLGDSSIYFANDINNIILFFLLALIKWNWIKIIQLYNNIFKILALNFDSEDNVQCGGNIKSLAKYLDRRISDLNSPLAYKNPRQNLQFFWVLS